MMLAQLNSKSLDGFRRIGPMKETAKSVLAWTAGAVLSASILWWLLGGVLYGTFNGAPVNLDTIYVSLMWTGSFGLITCIVFAAPYSAVLWLWMTGPPRIRGLEASRRGIVAGTLLLSLPAILVVSLSFGGWPTALPFNWDHFLSALPYVTASAWGGFLVPRLVLRRLSPLVSRPSP
jgi:hypothetical protein